MKNKGKSENKQVSELDKHIKTLILKGAVGILREEEEKGVFEQVYPPKDKEKYEKYTIYDDIRKAFEKLAYPLKPDFLSLSQFEAIIKIGEEHKLEELNIQNFSESSPSEKFSPPHEFNDKLLTKSLLMNLYKQYARSGNKSLMNLKQFTRAIDGLSLTLYPAFYTKYERMSKITEKIINQ